MKIDHATDKDFERAKERIEFLKEEVIKYKYDKLTKLKGKIDFDEKLTQLFEEQEFERKPFSFILVDADGLHNTNYLDGREAGDNLLVSIATEITDRYEGFGTDIYRISGDEFGVFITDESKCDIDNIEDIENATFVALCVCDTSLFMTPSEVYKEADNMLSAKKTKKKLAARV